MKNAWIAVVVTTVLLAACASPSGGPAYSPADVTGSWRLEILDDHDVLGFKVRLDIDGSAQRIRGFDACGALDGGLRIIQHRLQAVRLNPTVACDGRAREIRDAVRLVLAIGGRLSRLTREGRDWLALEGAGHEMLLARR